MNNNRRWVAALLLVLAAALPAACGGQDSTPQAKGTVDASGAAAARADAGAGTSATAADGSDAPPPEATCSEAQPVWAPGGTALTLPIALFAEQKAVVFGEKNTLKDGAIVMPGNLRFYISAPSLLGAGGTKIPVDLVAADGHVLPYGVQLVDAGTAGSMVVRLRVPPGSYTGISFTLGLPDVCNDNGTSRMSPLDDASGMTWPPPFGYLFLRYEATVTLPGGRAEKAGDPVRVVHMAGLPRALFAPVVSASGGLTVTSAPLTRPLRLYLDELFKAIWLPVEPLPSNIVTPPPGIGFDTGEALRQNAPKVKLFTLP